MGLTRVMAASSSAPLYLKVMRCFSISAKYSLASLLVLVPRPATQTLVGGSKATAGRSGGLRPGGPTFVVLDVPALMVLRLFLPLFKLGDAVEGHFLLVLGRLFARRGHVKLPVHLQQADRLQEAPVTLTMGVMNSSRKVCFRSDGQL